jgi:hypothetical protein
LKKFGQYSSSIQSINQSNKKCLKNTSQVKCVYVSVFNSHKEKQKEPFQNFPINYSKTKNSMSTMVDYGYGEATPDSATADYGYDDAQPDYGYGDTDRYGYEKYDRHDVNPSSKNKGNKDADYGYGDAQPSTNHHGGNKTDDTTDYGYGDVDYGYGDATPDGGDNNTGDDDEPKRRPRRRNSVTRYSIVCQDQVKDEFASHENAIDQFRNGMVDAPAGPPPASRTTAPLNDEEGNQYHSYSDDDMSQDGDGKKKKKKWGWGFRIGCSASKDSNQSCP